MKMNFLANIKLFFCAVGLVLLVSCASSAKSSPVLQPAQAFNGLWFYNVRGSNVVRLENPDGSAYHEWALSGVSKRFNYPLILGGGRLVFVDFEGMLGIIDADSKKIWQKQAGAHHDVDLLTPDSIITFNRALRYLPQRDLNAVDELISVHSVVDGTVLKQLSLYDALAEVLPLNDILTEVWTVQQAGDASAYFLADGSYNMFHANSISVLRRDYNEVFSKGRVLVSVRNLSLLVLIDLETEEIVWHWGRGVIDHQHYPVMTETGSILVYDNGLATRDFTRVLEIEPLSGEVLWSYNMDGSKGFFSRVMGSAQPLPNGNVLITESVSGRIFEILRDGTIVGETKKADSVYRCEKFDTAFIDALMNNQYASNREIPRNE